MSETVLVHFSRARLALQKAKTIDEVKTVIDAAERLRLYLRQANESLEMQNDAAEIAILAKHRAGEMLDEGVKNGLLAKQGRPKKPDSVSGFSRPATLKEVSVGEKESSRLRTLSGIPKKQLESIIQDYKQERKELNTNAILREVREIKRERAEERVEVRRGKAEQALQGNPALLTSRYQLWQGDAIETARNEIAPASVDAIITDPPYPAEFLQAFSDLSELAARVLKPGGSCLVMSGQCTAIIHHQQLLRLRSSSARIATNQPESRIRRGLSCV